MPIFAERLHRSVDVYGPDAVVPFDDLLASCRNRR